MLCSNTPIYVLKSCGMFVQAQEIVKTPAYQASDHQEALVQAFLRIDEMLAQESTQAELHALAGPQHHDDEEE